MTDKPMVENLFLPNFEKGDFRLDKADGSRGRCMLMEWQPIETAPKNGERVLVWCPTWSAASTAQYYSHIGKWLVMYGVAPFISQPTHWMPLPDPPVAAT